MSDHAVGPLQPRGEQIHYTYGLHKRCSSLTNSCEPFPRGVDCQADRYFCSMWRSVGFLMSFGIVLEGMTIIAYAVILAGGKQKREKGWKILAALHGVCAALLIPAMSIIVRGLNSHYHSINSLPFSTFFSAGPWLIL